MLKPKLEEPSTVNSRIPWSIWLSSGVVICLLVFSTAMLMVKYQPLVRRRELQRPTVEETTSGDNVFQRFQMDKSPDTAEPEIGPDDAGSETVTIINQSSVRRKMQQSQKPNAMNYSAIKLPNGTIHYVFPEKPEDQSIESAPVARPDLDNESICTPENPMCSNIRSKDENDKIDQIMKAHEHLYSGVFGNDLVIPDGDRIATRYDNDEEEVPFCVPRERLIHPEYGFDKEKRKIKIINTKKFEQGVRVEYCENTDHECSTLSTSLGYQYECKQMYYTRTLVAIHPEKGTPYKEQFVLPSCCKCVRKEEKASRRIGW